MVLKPADQSREKVKSEARSRIGDLSQKVKAKCCFLPRLWESQKAEHLETENCLRVSNTWLPCS